MQRVHGLALGQSRHVLNAVAGGRKGGRGKVGLRVRGGDGGGGCYHTSTQGSPYVSEDTRVQTSGHCCRCCCSTRDPQALPRPFTLSYRWVSTQTHRGVLTAGKCQRHICPKKTRPSNSTPVAKAHAVGSTGGKNNRKKMEISDTVSPLIALLAAGIAAGILHNFCV